MRTYHGMVHVAVEVGLVPEPAHQLVELVAVLRLVDVSLILRHSNLNLIKIRPLPLFKVSEISDN